MPQSYDFIIKPARDFREKFLKKLEIVEYLVLNGLSATMKRWRIDPFCTIILPSNQPVPFPYHPVLWQGQLPCAYQP